MVAERRINKAGLDLVKISEGLRLHAYPDPATGGDPWTIGYGSTGKDVYRGVVITEEQAEALLLKDLSRFEAGVTKLAPMSTDNQFAALVSFAFNLGLENLKTSTLLRMHNAGDYKGAQKQFIRWNKANGKIMPGLTTRRQAEATLYGEP